MPINPRALDLAAEWVALRDQGTPITLDELCAREPELRAEVERRIGQILRFDAADQSSPAAPAAAGAGLSPTRARGENGAAEAPAEVGPYKIEEEIARGGMGVVFRARDADFGRTLAVKVLQRRHRGDPDLPRRFLEEAQITGQLQHPGIPPVHAVGKLEDGRPYFAMKLIKGRTLAELLREGQGTDEPASLPSLLTIFTQVCQTTPRTGD